jgi:flagellar P-ring protein precursor FlgI
MNMERKRTEEEPMHRSPHTTEDPAPAPPICAPPASAAVLPRASAGGRSASQRILPAALVFAAISSACIDGALAARVKDLVKFEGVRGNQLVGYGLVVGLNGTGDGNQSVFTPLSIANMLRRLGVVVDPAKVRVKNTAAVMISAEVPPFARAGRTLDVTVSSIGDAKSIAGGTLILTPLKGPDGQVYASAQGSVSVGGSFSASAGGASATRNHPTAGRIPSGAFLERDVVFDLGSRPAIRLLLNDPDFTTAARIERAVNEKIGSGTAHAEDSGGVLVKFPAGEDAGTVGFLSRIEDIAVDPDSPARLVFNEKTGTVVMGADLRISRVAISHGELSVQVESETIVSQPMPDSKKGETVVTDQPTITAKEEPARVLVLDEGASIADLVKGLNRIGATSRDMIAIFQAIRAAGALQAEIIVQ